MSDFQRKCSVITCALLIIGVVLSIASLILPEWILNFDITEEPGIRYVKYGIFQRCTKPEGESFECGMFWTSDMQPGEGDWVTGCRAMLVLGVLAALASAVLAILFVIIKLTIIAIIVLICACVGAASSVIGVAVWVHNWSYLWLRYPDQRPSHGFGIWLMAVAIIFYVLACTIQGGALLMRVGKKTNRSSNRPVFERREPTHSTKGMMSSSKV